MVDIYIYIYKYINIYEYVNIWVWLDKTQIIGTLCILGSYFYIYSMRIFHNYIGKVMHK